MTAVLHRWLTHPVVLVDTYDEGVEEFSWIEATDEITSTNAAEEFKRQMPDEILNYDGEEPRKALGVTGPHWHVPYHPDYYEGEVPVPLDYKDGDLYFCEQVTWTKILLGADNAVPLWRIEWSAVGE